MPALVNSKLGLSGMRLELETIVCCLERKKSKNDWRIWADVMVYDFGISKHPGNRQRRIEIGRKIGRTLFELVPRIGGAARGFPLPLAEGIMVSRRVLLVWLKPFG
jgi:hypothetical protein